MDGAPTTGTRMGMSNAPDRALPAAHPVSPSRLINTSVFMAAAVCRSRATSKRREALGRAAQPSAQPRGLHGSKQSAPAALAEVLLSAKPPRPTGDALLALIEAKTKVDSAILAPVVSAVMKLPIRKW
jgi:hypothetical protein